MSDQKKRRRPRLVGFISLRRRPKPPQPSISTGAPKGGGEWLLPDEEITGQSRKAPLGRGSGVELDRDFER